jgi:coenzyme F420 hydrogenase subunit beta
MTRADGPAKSTGWDILKSRVIDENLCTRCGSCVGVCPRQALTFEDPLGDCLPTLIGDCSGCDAPCLVGCPGLDVDFPRLTEFVFPGQESDFLLGVTKGQYIAYSSDPHVRSQAASGGVITSINQHLLETGQVDGVATLIVTDDDPLRPKPVIATDAETLLLAQQSKYSIAPLNTIMAELESFQGVVSMVALPCQVHSIRKLQAAGHSEAVGKIKVLIGSYCGTLMHFQAITDLLGKFGVHDLKEVTKLEYRAGEWPGKTRITLADGRVHELGKFYANYMNLLYPVERCLTCTDLTSEFADISGGDAWAPVYEERGQGFSLLVTRTEIGEQIVQECVAKGKIVVAESITREAAITMHSHGLDNKKNGGFLRIQHRKILRKTTPEYGYSPRQVTHLRKALAIPITVALMMGQTRIMRWFVLLLPLNLVGAAFKRLRVLWKKWTSPERKKGILGFQATTYPIVDQMVEEFNQARVGAVGGSRRHEGAGGPGADASSVVPGPR